METQKERLSAFIESLGYSVREFERALEVSNGTVRHTTDNLSANLKEKISTKFPQLNQDWLLLGTGQMLNSPIGSKTNGANSMQYVNGDQNQNGIPPQTVEKLIEEMRAQREANEKERDRLLTIIEKLTIK